MPERLRECLELLAESLAGGNSVGRDLMSVVHLHTCMRLSGAFPLWLNTQNGAFRILALSFELWAR